MAYIDWGEAFAIFQILIAIGSLGGNLPICWYILVAEISLMMYVVLPIFMLWGIYLVFGKICAIIAVILACIFIGYHFYLGRQIEK